MVQVIENRTEIEGKVISQSPHPTLQDHDLLKVEVTHAAPVSGYPDLLSEHAGSTLELAVRREALPEGAIDGKAIHGRAFLGGPDAMFVEPMPDSSSLVS